MAPKRKLMGKSESGTKRQRKVMTLSEKIELLNMLARGESAASVGRHYGINESTVWYIRKHEKNIRASVAAGAPQSAKVAFQSRDPNIERMEKALNVWIEDKTQKKAPLSGPVIREKALHIYKNFCEESGGEGSSSTMPTHKFQASKGWFENFKKRFNLHNVKLVGEIASADHDAAEKYPPQLKKLIEEKGYRPEQVFNADETGLFWKRMPSRIFLSKQERSAPEFKVAKDRLTLLLCGNAAGDFIVKPMLLYRALNPHALKGQNKSQLPVFWQSNRRAWVTAALFIDWFNNCFVHEVEKYLASKNLAFKVLLILDNAPGHPESLQFAHPNVEVVFLPPNTTSLLQPMDQGLIKTFKSYYTRHTFKRILDQMESDPTLTVSGCWKNYNIADCINNIKDSLEEVKPTTWNACWRKLWSEAVNDFQGFPSVDEEVRRILKMAHEFGGEGFEDMQVKEVEELLESHQEDLTEEDLEELLRSGGESDEEEKEEEVMVPKPLTTKMLAEVLQMGKALADKVFEIDPFMERSIKFKRALEAAMMPYKESYRDLQNKAKQSTITSFFNRDNSTTTATATTTTPAATHSPPATTTITSLTSPDDPPAKDSSSATPVGSPSPEDVVEEDLTSL
ncbi:tigger transposable element-derived protein 1-like [Latimeria chalumnae]|uniref:tigger transposable element-derived protein 1-like n=1 Tax=Latimeria chalumnae TaxID=7897 RepID=UPI00313E4D7E